MKQEALEKQSQELLELRLKWMAYMADGIWSMATDMRFHKYIGNDPKVRNAKPEYEPTFPRWAEYIGATEGKESKRNKTGDELIEEFFSGMAGAEVEAVDVKEE